MSNLVHAGLTITAIFFCALTGVLVPLVLVPVTPRITKIGNSFAAGFLASAAIVHLLPSAHDTMTQAMSKAPSSDDDESFPYDGLATLIGATIVFLIDFSLRSSSTPTNSITTLDGTNSGTPHTHSHTHAHAHSHKPCQKTTSPSPRSPSTTSAAASSSRLIEYRWHLPPPSVIDGNYNATSSSVKLNMTGDDANADVNGTPHLSSNTSSSSPSSASRLGIAMILAVTLSIHSLVEGISLGTSLYNAKEFSIIALAILAHKFFAALSLGTSLATTHSSPLSIYAAFVFALATPVGAVLGGMLVTIVSLHSTIVSAWLTCLSAGIFLYVAFVDLLADEVRECNSHDDPDFQDRTLRAFVFVFAASAMSLLAIWT